MTALAVRRVKSTALGRIAGVLLVVGAGSMIGGDIIDDILEKRVFSGQGDTDPEFLYLGPTIILAILSIATLLVAFVLIFVWLPKTLFNAVFLALPVFVLLAGVLGRLGGSNVVWGLAYAVGALLAGVAVMVGRSFALGANILFLALMVLVALQYVEGIAPASVFGSLVFESALRYAISATLGAFGLALLIWPRSRSKATEERA